MKEVTVFMGKDKLVVCSKNENYIDEVFVGIQDHVAKAAEGNRIKLLLSLEECSNFHFTD